MSTPARSLPHQRHTALPRRGSMRVRLVLVMLLGFAGQLLLTAASLPEESPRAAILRLTGLDIAPAAMTGPASSTPPSQPMADDAPCPEHDPSPSTLDDGQINGQAGRHAPALHHTIPHHTGPAAMAHTARHATGHGTYQPDGQQHGEHHHSHHHGLDCPLCPLLGHVIFALSCLAVLLGYSRLSRQLWQDAAPSYTPPEPPYQRPPSRGPPHTILTHVIA